MKAVSLLTVVLVGCGGSDTREAPRTPEEIRARDSAIGASALPGAGGVRRALEVADSAAARSQRIDGVQPGSQ